MNVYQGTIGNYSFIMNDDDRIEVWENTDDSNPFTYIFVRTGSIDNEKKFHSEIAYWHMDNVR